MVSFEKEGSWSLCFSGAGFLGLYHVGVSHCLRERAPRLLQGAHRFYGSSSGALNAVALACGKPVDFCCSQVLGMVQVIKRLSLGVLHPAFAPIEYIKLRLQEHLPANAHILASNRLGISLTRWPDGKNVIVTHFATRDELIQALLCTLYLPFYCGVIPPEFRGERYFDGSMSNNLPSEDPNATITVAPLHGTVDICPQSTSASLHELNICNTVLQMSTKNFFLGFCCLFPPSPETLADICRQGYLDALRFLERRGLIKEPILWVLVSKEPPAPTEGTQDAGCDEGRKAGLNLNWAVPNVFIEAVADFKQLSPELEAALRKACAKDPSIWAQFWQSGPGQVLTYLLLPCTLPVEYAYFRSRRIVAWLPDVPADLCWMQGLLRRSAHEFYSRIKAQLFRAVRLPATMSFAAGPLQPGAAPLVDSALEPRPTQQT
ncbi:patatin-like phospholipase domain-containing protein 5 [Loxodonta africana]|uniref:patatin-like phospholipase domain-containing protein 5 n=1 Tax=Loxodonta africana TaxID=9785 RepID=UPI0030CF1198